MGEILFFILWFLCGVMTWFIYHKLFTIWYADLAKGCLKEFITASFLGLIMAAMIVYYWPIVVAIIALIMFAFFKRK